MPVTRSRSPSRLLRSDPIAYANRPLDPEFDEYQAVREHVSRLYIEPSTGKRPMPA